MATAVSSSTRRRRGCCRCCSLAPWAVLLALAAALGGWLYAAIQPDPPTPCGTPGGPPVTAPRIRLRDGRFLAYSESGVPRDQARYKLVLVHGFTGCRLDGLRASNDTIKELGVYMVAYDRAGYGESDPNPSRSVKSEVLDIQELADALGLGSRFYLVGYSLGGHAVWGALKYIPGRLAGAALLAPVVNYRWPGLPKSLSTLAYYQQDKGDQWALRVAYYAPWLLNWWMKQSWLPTSTVVSGSTFLPNQLDAQIRKQFQASGAFQERIKLAAQQGVHESLHRDMMVMFGRWNFDPIDILPPSSPVHVWQGDEDGLVPVTLQRYICSRLPWIEYHELQKTGHYLQAIPSFGDLVLKTLLVQPLKI